MMTAGSAMAHLRDHRLDHRQCSDRVCLEESLYGLRGGQFNRRRRAKAGIVDKNVDVTCGLDQLRNAFGIGDVEREDLQTIGRRKQIPGGGSHCRHHIPASFEEQFCGFEAKAGGTTGNQYVGHSYLHTG